MPACLGADAKLTHELSGCSIHVALLKLSYNPFLKFTDGSEVVTTCSVASNCVCLEVNIALRYE